MKLLFAKLFIKDLKAATAIEYSLIAAGIALAVVAIVFLIGDDVLGLFTTTETELSSRVGN